MILLNGNPLDITRFPDNTTQVWKLPEALLQLTNFAHITWEFSQEGEFLHIAQLKDLLDSYGIASALRIKYLPYARQDKKIANDATFALRTFAKLLNCLEFPEVVIHDPHSLIAIELINNARAVYPEKQLAKVMELTNSDFVCYPDKGALTKYSKIYSYTYSYGEKVRDQATGHITSYELFDQPTGKTVLIVDDIIDGGMTFKILAKQLLAAGAKEVNLFASHGIFSAGVKTITDSGIKRIFTESGEIFDDKNGNFSVRKYEQK